MVILFILLIRMKPIESDKQQLIQLCKNEYENNPKELVFVGEFEKDYRSDKALWWYTTKTISASIIYSCLSWSGYVN